jgi:D-alanyl-lipoteichoic acid acyltransferase DltB (MBOAT superfamily)
MLFGTPVFILGFLPVALAGAILAAWRRGRRASLCWVLAASLVFYGWWSPVFVLLLVGSILVNYGLASKIRSGPAGRWWLIGGLAANLGVLGLFKYAAFLAALFTGGTVARQSG